MAAIAETTPSWAGGMAPAPFRVERRRRETHDTWTLELAPDSGAPLEVRPGQFTMLYAFGVGEVPVSVSGTESGRLTQTIRDVGAVTHAICTSRRGDVLGVRGPFGNSWPLEQAEGADVVIVAGGIGLAPLRSSLHHMLARRSDYGSAALLYGARTPDDLVYRRELERWRARLDLDVGVTVDGAGTEWRGQVGVVTKLIAQAVFEPASAVVLVCGPEIMMRFSAQALEERGVPAEQIHLSMERNMRCGLGHCGHCQLGPTLICRDGPIYRYDRIRSWLEVREL